jgi:aryl-alcohol dehydrogenase
MRITAAVVPVRSAPFEIETLDLTPPLADEVLVRVVASGMCHTDLHARDGYFPNLPYPSRVTILPTSIAPSPTPPRALR